MVSLALSEVISKIRGGDYLHPGEEEAIDKTFSSFKKSSGRLLLDVGCSIGGTADYLQKAGLGKVIGIDINNEMVNSARKKYSNNVNYKNKINLERLTSPVFFACDVLESHEVLTNFFGKIAFDVIYIFNSFFLFPDHSKALNILRKLSHKNTKMIIFDFVDCGIGNKDYLAAECAENSGALETNYIRYNQIDKMFAAEGWGVESVKDITQDYIRWDRRLIEKINACDKEEWVYSVKYCNVFQAFKKRSKDILQLLEAKKLGGFMIYLSPN